MFTIPDKGEGDNDLQSILFQEYLEVLVAGIDGMNCVLSGLVVTGGAGGGGGSPFLTPCATSSVARISFSAASIGGES